MMVNVDNANSSSVGFGLEDLPHILNNNNNDSEAKSEDDIRRIDKVSFKSKLMMLDVQTTRNINHERLRECFYNVRIL